MGRGSQAHGDYIFQPYRTPHDDSAMCPGVGTCCDEAVAVRLHGLVQSLVAYRRKNAVTDVVRIPLELAVL